jgi:hypothetical protein
MEEAAADFQRIVDLGTNPDLALQAADELEAMTPVDMTGLVIHEAEAGTNLARYTHVRVSREIIGFAGARAVDGSRDSWWSAGDFAPHWIEIDLGTDYLVSEIRLLVTQSPGGLTNHRVVVKGLATGYVPTEIHTFEGRTIDSAWLSFKPDEPLVGIRYVRIESTSSPSWIGWREIEVIAAGP